MNTAIVSFLSFAAGFLSCLVLNITKNEKEKEDLRSTISELGKDLRVMRGVFERDLKFTANIAQH